MLKPDFEVKKEASSWRRLLALVENTSNTMLAFLLKDARLLRLSSSEIVVAVRDEIVKKKLEGTYYTILKSFVKSAFGKDLEVNIVVSNSPKAIENPIIFPVHDTSLDPDFTFENMVVGRSNRLAVAMAKDIVDSPGEINPLFVFGPSSSGKTHLLKAVGNAMKEKGIAKVVYINAQKFVKELGRAVGDSKKGKHSRIKDFWAGLRSSDVLLFDDVHLVGGKSDYFAMELQGLFDYLHERKRQLVFASLYPVKEMSYLPSSLRNRFLGGYVAEMKLPDYNMRLEFLKRKNRNEEILPQTIEFIAKNVRGGYRQLSGAFDTVLKYQRLTKGEKVTPTIASEILKGIIGDFDTDVVDEETALKEVCEVFGVHHKEILMGVRTKEVTKARKAVVYVCRKVFGTSYPRIGKLLSINHSAAVYSFKAAKKLYQKDESFRSKIDIVLERLGFLEV